MTERESMPYDVVIVGGGPAGLAAAIRLKQLAETEGRELSCCVLEKGSEIGAHILSGAVIDPRALDELLPDWRDQNCPMADVPVIDNQHWVLTKTRKFTLPHLIFPKVMRNQATYTGSLGSLTRWLAERAETLGVEIFPGFAAAEILYDEHGAVRGVATGASGIARDGSHKSDYEPGLELHAKYTLFAEGARGHLTRQLKVRYDLDKQVEPQIYGLGVKELWEIDPAKHCAGTVIHSQGWPLTDANGGGFIYHQANNQLAIGFVTWLNYKNPYLSPFEEMQRWKHHPAVRTLLEGGRRVSYGARAINDGGYQSVPQLHFPGGALIGCSAGFVNVPRIKGSHTAMKTGMLAAEAVFAAIGAGRANDDLPEYGAAYEASWVRDELFKVRNVVPLVKKFGNLAGSALAGIALWCEHLGLKWPFTMGHTPDHAEFWRADMVEPITYPKPDGVISFDRLSSVFISNTNHAEDQPGHLLLADPDRPIAYTLPIYAEPAQRYCPAGVYEVVEEAGGPRFQINAQNCVHCKTCDILDPTQNITWVAPQGGGGPNYPNM